MNDIHKQEIEDFDLQKTIADYIEKLETTDSLSEEFVESIHAEMDRLSRTDTLSEKEQQEMMDVLAAGKPIITEEILDTIKRMVEKPGIVTLHHSMTGHKRKPFRGKIICHIMRSADGDEVQIPKIARRPNGPKTMVLPFTEKHKLFHLADNDAKGPMDQRWKDLVTRFSAAYTVLDRIVQGMQEEKILLPEDATEERIERVNKILYGEGNPETKEAKAISGGTDSATVEDKTDKGSDSKKD